MAGETGKAWRSIDVDETADTVRASKVTLYMIHAVNVAATPLYLKFYDTSPTVGTTTPVWTFAVPSQSDSNGGGFNIRLQGTLFIAGLWVACVTGVADADTTGAGANELVLNLEID